MNFQAFVQTLPSNIVIEKLHKCNYKYSPDLTSQIWVYCPLVRSSLNGVIFRQLLREFERLENRRAWEGDYQHFQVRLILKGKLYLNLVFVPG